MGLRTSRSSSFMSTFWILIFFDRQDRSRERPAISFLTIFCMAISIRREMPSRSFLFRSRQRLLPGEPCHNGSKGFQVRFEDTDVRNAKAFTVRQHLFADLIHRANQGINALGGLLLSGGPRPKVRRDLWIESLFPLCSDPS